MSSELVSVFFLNLYYRVGHKRLKNGFGVTGQEAFSVQNIDTGFAKFGPQFGLSIEIFSLMDFLARFPITNRCSLVNLFRRRGTTRRTTLRRHVSGDLSVWRLNWSTYCFWGKVLFTKYPRFLLKDV